MDAGVRATRPAGRTGAGRVGLPAPGVGSASPSRGAPAAGGRGCAAGSEPGVGIVGPVAWRSAGSAVGSSGEADRGVAARAGGTGVGASGAVGAGVRDSRLAGLTVVEGGPAEGAADWTTRGAETGEGSSEAAAGSVWRSMGWVSRGVVEAGSGGAEAGRAGAGGAAGGFGPGRSTGPSRILAPRPCSRPPRGGRRESLRSWRGPSLG
jgi:hypothetical protein